MKVGSVCTKYICDNVAGPNVATMIPTAISRRSFVSIRMIDRVSNATAIGHSALITSAVCWGSMSKAHSEERQHQRPSRRPQAEGALQEVAQAPSVGDVVGDGDVGHRVVADAREPTSGGDHGHDAADHSHDERQAAIVRARCGPVHLVVASRLAHRHLRPHVSAMLEGSPAHDDSGAPGARGQGSPGSGVGHRP